MNWKIIRLIVIVFVSTGYSAIGQDVSDFLERYTGNDAENYIRPLADAAGADFNSGWYRSAKVERNGFHLYIGLVAQSAPIADKNKTFTAVTPDHFSPATNAEVSTVLGPPSNTSVQGDNGTTYTFPGGVGVSSLPFAVPQLTIGNVFGTDASFRFFAIELGDDIGKVNVFGWGIRHSISQYFTGFPVDLAIGYYANNFDVGDDLDATASLISLQGSWRTGVLEIYGGPGYELVRMDFTYTPGGSDDRETISVESNNTVRMTIGAAVNLGSFVLNADVNLANQTSFSAGLGVQIGNRKNIKSNDETNN